MRGFSAELQSSDWLDVEKLRGGDSEGEGKSMRDGRVGFTIVSPVKAAAGKRQEPTRASCSGGEAEGGSAKANRADTVPLML